MTDGTLGTPLTPASTRALLLGAGELGKEVALELQRLELRGARGLDGLELAGTRMLDGHGFLLVY